MKNYINPANGDYYAWICLSDEELNSVVPSQFLNSEWKKWKEYTTVTTDPEWNKFILAWYRDENWNRKDRITKEEFDTYLEHFEGRNIRNLDEAQEYMKQFMTDEV